MSALDDGLLRFGLRVKASTQNHRYVLSRSAPA